LFRGREENELGKGAVGMKLDSWAANRRSLLEDGNKDYRVASRLIMFNLNF
jgi:hypothetical protein